MLDHPFVIVANAQDRPEYGPRYPKMKFRSCRGNATVVVATRSPLAPQLCATISIAASDRSINPSCKRRDCSELDQAACDESDSQIVLRHMPIPDRTFLCDHNGACYLSAKNARMQQYGIDFTIPSQALNTKLLPIQAIRKEYDMSENLTVRREGNLWTCADDEHDLRAVGFIDLVVGIRKALGVHKFTVTFDCEGSEIDGATATYDFGPPDPVSDI